MNYGYFDDDRREYVITRPDTPAAWANYLGSPEYGALISNQAGGYSFVKSGANGRLLRYRFDESDTPGRYIYIRDDEAQDYWSASWQPVGKDLKEYESECRHGLGYTAIRSRYRDIESEAVWYVPLDKEWEVWHLKLKNTTDRERRLSVTGYAEFTNDGNYEQDTVNLQYSRFITRTFYQDGLICQQINGNLDAMEQKMPIDRKMVTERFFGLAGHEVSSWCGDKEAFIGRYHDYGNPAGVIRGSLGNQNGWNEYGCGALCASIVLAPGEETSVTFVLGEKRLKEAGRIRALYEEKGRTDAELSELRAYWDGKLNHFQVHTPCPEFDTMINIWNAYNCFMTFIWSRAASFTYCGLRNGYGYRDTVQDIQGIIHLEPEMAAGKIRFMLTAQVDNGAGLPLVKFTHNPGHEDTPDDASYVKETGHPAYRADDALWLFPTVYKYIAQSGNIGFLKEILPFANRDEGTVYEHLKRAIRFSLDHLGPHDMPAGLYADWNDCLRLGEKGESSFVAFQFYYALSVMRSFAERLGETADEEWLEKEMKHYADLIQQNLWDKDRFIRGFTQDGETIGCGSDPEANIWLNPQSWSVISKAAGPDQAEKAMELVHERLNTPYGALLMDPPYHSNAFSGALAVIYNPGAKENAGIFSQSQGWLVLAEALLGHGDRAFEYWAENAPSLQNHQAEIRKLEPYCYGQFTEGKDSPHFGRSHVHWLTGTASTMMVGCVEGILGIRPDLDGICIAPSIPSKWDKLELDMDFRGKRLHVRIENPDHRQAGVREMTVNGRKVGNQYIPVEFLEEENQIRIQM